MATRSRWQDGRRAWQRLNGWHQREGHQTAGVRKRDGESALRALDDVRQVRDLLLIAEQIAVQTARAHGQSWNEIAAALGVSRQAAWEKWRDDVERASGT